MAAYLNDQYCQMVLLYGQGVKKALEAASRNADRFPTGPDPTPWITHCVAGRLRMTGSIASRLRSVPSSQRSVQKQRMFSGPRTHTGIRPVRLACG